LFLRDEQCIATVTNIVNVWMVAVEMCGNVHGSLHGHMEHCVSNVWPATAKRKKSFILELLLI